MKKNTIKVLMVCLSILFSLACVDHFTCVDAHCMDSFKGYWDPSGQYHELPPEKDLTPEEEFETMVKVYRGMGWSEEAIQRNIPELRKELGLDSSEATPSTKSSIDSSSSQPSSKSAPSYTKEQIEAAWEETGRVEATCGADGSVSYKNSLTGKTKTEKSPATGLHTFEVTEHVGATCVADGHEIRTCSVCGETQTEVIPATGHKEGNPAATKKAGWFSEGELTVCCEVCGEVLLTEVIPQTCPLALWQIIVIAIGIVILVLAVTMLAMKNKAKVCLQ